MTQTPKERPNDDHPVEPDEVAPEERSYYYDDAHGYQTYVSQDENEDQEDDESATHCTEKTGPEAKNGLSLTAR